jgi:hypothetical protein
MSEKRTQLILEVHKSQSQFAYFQLGVAASAIAFAVHETTGDPLLDTPWPIGAAVALWALSFALGCFGLDRRHEALTSNANYLKISGHIPANVRGDPEWAKTIQGMENDVAKGLARTNARFRWQKWALFAGAIAYIGGHVMQMSAIPPNFQVDTRRAAPTGQQ